ncbi:MAG: DUF58 domain-containing protein [Planctomycetes bacterium]|jgi:uncharacterized protein (DUF58 family)|nr:DUF58 domain-containing protein [Planctomycetota bacterium]MDP6423505.1 DUF58 domain-containing protein [Planctomycetota bacterium]
MRQEHQLKQIDTLDSRQFFIAVRRLADTLSYGSDSSRFLGSGIEYVQSRIYHYGDPIRTIDWRVTARTAKVHVKEHEAPKRIPCYLLIDTSASMTISSTKRSKYATAVHIAGGLAFACLDRISPVGIVAVGDRELRVEPNLSKLMIMQWLLQLRRFRYDEGTNLARRVAQLTPSLKSRCLVIVLSDMHDDTAVDALKLLGQAHDIVALQLMDPAELGVRGAGFLRATEAETGKEFVSLGRQVWLDQDALETGLRRGGIDHLVIRTDEPFAHKLRHYFVSRNLFGRGAR